MGLRVTSLQTTGFFAWGCWGKEVSLLVEKFLSSLKIMANEPRMLSVPRHSAWFARTLSCKLPHPRSPAKYGLWLSPFTEGESEAQQGTLTCPGF